MPSPDSSHSLPGSVPVVQFPALTPPRHSANSPVHLAAPSRSVVMQQPSPVLVAAPGGPAPGSGEIATSIWRDRRPSSLSFNAQNVRNSMRARAGTLPSRLQTAQAQEVTEQLGSLALLSPNTDQMPADPAAGRVGRHTSTHSDAGLRPFPSLLASRSRGTSPSFAAGTGQPYAPPPALPTGSAIDAQIGAPSPQIRPRKRSGSLNSAASNTAFSPFAPSIWNAPQSMSPEHSYLHPYMATPQRLRSHTFGTTTHSSAASTPGAERPAASEPPVPPPTLNLYQPPRAPAHGVNPAGAVGGPVPRSRASTIATAAARHPSPPSGMTLGRYVAHSINDIPDNYVVTVDDMSPTPTLCLWVNNVAQTATAFSLRSLFGQYGHVDAARVLPSCNSAFVRFADLQSAIDAQQHTNTVELFVGQGPSLVGFVKSSEPSTPAPSAPSAPPPLVHQSSFAPPPPPGACEIVDTLAALGAPQDELEASAAMVARARGFGKYESETGLLPEQADRVFVSAVLRDVRKRIDNEQLADGEIEELALAMMTELPVLASDYMGNTVVQQLFDHCSSDLRDMMLREIKPYLAQTGVHKNGTWAAQKIIDVASTARQYSMIVEAIRPFVVPLFLDQYGNYVIQCCLKFGAPWNDFIFEAIVAKMPEIAQGRFGARAVRACLESPHTSKQQQRLVAAAIVENAALLSTNANGSLLVSWLLDTHAAPARFGLVTRRLLPVLSVVASSKLGSQVLLKAIGNRIDQASTRLILDALLDLGSDSPTPILEALLQDTVNGPMFLFKLLNTGLAEYSLERQVAVNKIRMLLLRPDAVIPTHKRLLEEVGLSMLTPSEDTRSLSPPGAASADSHDQTYQNYPPGNGLPLATAPPPANNYQEWLRY